MVPLDFEGKCWLVFADFYQPPENKSNVPSGQDRPLFMKTTVRGRPVMVDSDKYEYRLERTVTLKKSKEQKTYWACRHTNKTSCNARLITVGGENDLKILSKGPSPHICGGAEECFDNKQEDVGEGTSVKKRQRPSQYVPKKRTSWPLKKQNVPSGQDQPLLMKTTEKGKPVIVDNDKYEYRLEKNVADSKDHRAYWICRSKKGSCNARLITVGEEQDFKIFARGSNLHKCKLPW